jgi:hypothetical protein
MFVHAFSSKLETPFALAVDRQLVPLESLDCRR